MSKTEPGFEWNTETSSNSTDPCSGRGGLYDNSNDYTSYRYSSNHYFITVVVFFVLKRAIRKLPRVEKFSIIERNRKI